MRKGRDGGKKTGGKKEREKTDENSGHYVIASSHPPDHWNAASSRQFSCKYPYNIIFHLTEFGNINVSSWNTPDVKYTYLLNSIYNINFIKSYYIYLILFYYFKLIVSDCKY